MQLGRRKFLRLGCGAVCSTVLPVAAANWPKSRARRDLTGLVNLADFERRARQVLPHMAYEYIAGGAGDEITMRWNREAFDAISLNPRVLVPAEPVDTRVTLFGDTLSLPLLLAPTAFHRLAHDAGETETARGANEGSVPFVVSSLSTRRFADIARETRQPLWFQFFTVQKERRDFAREVLHEVTENGCRAIVLTVDAPVTGARNRSERAGFQLPDRFETPYYPDRTGRKQSGGLPISGALTWKDVDWLRGETRLPVLLKGILNPEDAREAVRRGMDGIIVSNHGGRELDTVPASISVLPKVLEAVDNRIPVLMDSGIRRGTDILKAVALGAKAVLIGRPYLYGLAVGGAAGVAGVVRILRKELEMAMILSGSLRMGGLNRSVLGQVFH